MNVLITSASRKVSLVQAFRAAVARCGGGSIVAADSSPLSPALYCADEGIVTPRSSESHYMDFIANLCREREIRLIVPTRDEELPLFAHHRESLGKNGVTVMTAQDRVIQLCQDKLSFLEFCKREGFAVPKRYERPELVDRFPVFGRLRRDKGSQKSRKLDSKEELAAWVSSNPGAIIQEYVDAPEFTIDYFADFQGTPISAVPRERVRVMGGESFISRTRRLPALIQSAVGLATRIGLVGHNTIQCFLKTDGPYFIEVNPRYGGASALGFAAGAPTPEYLIQLVNGVSVSARLGEFEDNLVMLRYTADLFRPGAELDGPAT